VADFCRVVRCALGRRWEGTRRTLVVVYDVSKVVSSAVVCLAHAHRVVREVDIAVITWRMLGFPVELVEKISDLAVVVAVLKRKCLQKTFQTLAIV
jgi:hypothetical protein